MIMTKLKISRKIQLLASTLILSFIIFAGIAFKNAIYQQSVLKEIVDVKLSSITQLSALSRDLLSLHNNTAKIVRWHELGYFSDEESRQEIDKGVMEINEIINNELIKIEEIPERYLQDISKVLMEYREWLKQIKSVIAIDKSLTDIYLGSAYEEMDILNELMMLTNRYYHDSSQSYFADTQAHTSKMLWSFVFIFFSLVLLACSLAWYIGRSIIKPIRRLVAMTTSISNFNDLSKKIDIFGKDELSILAKSFNRMIDNLNNSYIELNKNNKELEVTKSSLEHFNQELENKVLHRTAQLTETNEYLQLEIQEREKTQQALSLAKQEAVSANESKSEFLAKMSHEIRTPTNAVIGLSQLTLKTNLTLSQQDLVEKILGSGEDLLRLINDILDYSKIEANKLHLESISFNLTKVIERTVAICSLKAHEKGIELILDIGQGLPDFIVGDPLRLQQILVNLTNNAIKFTERGHVIIRVQVVGQKNDDVALEFSVIDTGIGMTKNQQEKLFQSFSQVDESITRRFGGSGLGLAICHQLVEMMGGSICVNSSYRVGSEFVFSLNAKTTGVIKNQALSAAELCVGLHVLVVDDNDIARTILVDILKSFGVKISEASGGKQAVEMVKLAKEHNQMYNLILIDWKMPDLDGISASKLIRSYLTGQDTTTILLVSAYNRDEAKKLSVSAQLDGFLEKPVNASALFDATMTSIVKYNSSSVSTIVPTRSRKSNQANIPDLSHSKILLVEDNALNRQVALGFLDDTKAEVDIAENGLIAVNKVKASAYDLIFMDIQMPEMDGLTATREIRKICGISDVPIIAMTAHAMHGDRSKSLSAGMNEHLTKPLDQHELFDVLNKWILDDSPQGVSNKQVARINNTDEMALTETLLKSLEQYTCLDVEGALSRMGGKVSLYNKLVEDFVVEYTEFDQFLLSWIESGCKLITVEDLFIKIHSLKSNAFYLGATELGEQCKLAEEGLGNAKSCPLVIENIALLIKQLLNEIKPILSLMNTDKTPVDVSLYDIKDCVEKLVPLLEKSDFSSEGVLARLHALCLDTEYEIYVQQLLDLVDSIEFEEASLIAQTLMTSLTNEPELKEDIL